MDQALIVSFILSVMTASTPLLLAATGELITEKSGVLNLGVEGMMLVGAVVAFIVAATFKSPWLGVLAGIVAGAALALVFAVVTLTLQANQVASGLARLGDAAGVDVPGRQHLLGAGREEDDTVVGLLVLPQALHYLRAEPAAHPRLAEPIGVGLHPLPRLAAEEGDHGTGLDLPGHIGSPRAAGPPTAATAGRWAPASRTRTRPTSSASAAPWATRDIR